MRVLLTGGAGYIGSHTALVLLERGHEVIVLDDFSNGSIEAVRRVEQMTATSIPVIEADLSDRESVSVLAEVPFDAAIHLAGVKAVAESVLDPILYYRVNLSSTLNLLDGMRAGEVEKLVFSSTGTVYGVPQYLPQDEKHPVGVRLASPYARSKVMIEQMIHDVQAARPELAAVLLRYFNPVGAHPSGRIGEDPAGIPNNLLPLVAQVAVGRRDHLSVFGDDYPTIDGTGVRDYIHVMDLAEGHVAALERLEPGVTAFNLGSGIGSSVLEVVRAFEEASGHPIPYEVAPRRPGDVAEMLANPAKAEAELGWRATRTLAEACRDVWAWQRANPSGY